MTKEKMLFYITLQAGFMINIGLIEIPSRDILYEAILEIVDTFDPDTNKELDNYAWLQLIERFGDKKMALECGFNVEEVKNAGWLK